MTPDIPPLLPPDQTPPIRSLDDLDRYWRSIKGPWGFSAPQVWCAVFGPGGVVTPVLIKIEDCPDTPDPGGADDLLDRLVEVVEVVEVVDEFAPGGSAALMFARPGGDELRASDRTWARDLVASGRRCTIDVWPVFLANDATVRIVAPDDLAA